MMFAKRYLRAWDNYVPVVFSHWPYGAGGMAGLEYYVLTSASPLQSHWAAGLLVQCRTDWGYFTFTCQDLGGAFHVTLIKMSLQCWVLYLSFAKMGVDISAIPWPHGGGVVANDWCITGVFIEPLKNYM